MFVCHHCTTYSSHSFRRLCSHLRLRHPFSEIICNINSCKCKYSSIRSHVRHIKSKHFWFWEAHWKSTEAQEEGVELANVEQLPNVEEDYNNDNNEDNNDILETSTSSDNDIQLNHELLEDEVISFLLELREGKKASGVACEFVAKKLSSMLDLFCISQGNVIAAFQGNQNEDPARNFDDQWKNVSCQILKDLFDKFTNQKTFNSYISRKPGFIPPSEFRLNDDNIAKPETFQYISLLDTLKALLSKEDIHRHILSSPPPSSKKIASFRDGDIFSNSDFWQSSPQHLQIFLYFDDFNCSNPLGNKVRKCKISAFYFVLGNLPRKMRSALNSINLSILCKAKYIETYGYAPVLEPLVKDLIELEEKGIEVEIDGSFKTFHGSLALIIGDNLSQHGLGGFFESFSKTKRVCRLCMCQREHMADSFDENEYVMRSVESYKQNIDAMTDNLDLGRIYGIKAASEFIKLNHFGLIGQQPFDLHHDFFEGVAIDIVSNVLRSFIEDQMFTLHDINDRIQTFAYADCDKADKPQPMYCRGAIVNFKVKSTAIEMSNLLRLLPLLVGDLIPENNAIWELFLDFVKIVQFVLAPSLMKGEVLHFKDMIEEFFLRYKTLFPEARIKPKAHFVTHYPSQVLNLGPPSDHCTIRFEGKHNFFKNIYHRSNNTINITKSLATRHQYYMYLNYMKHSHKKENFEFVGGSEIATRLLTTALQNEISLIADNQIVFQAKSVLYEGQLYSSGSAVVLDYSNDDYVFGQVESVFNIEECLYLCLNCLKTVRFNPHFNAYEVVESQDIILKKVDELFDYHPLGIYNLVTVPLMLVPLRHYMSPPC